MRKFTLIPNMVKGSLVSLSIVLFNACSTNPDAENSENSVKNERMESKYYDGKGIGPIQDLKLESDIDHQLVESGQLIFNAKCTSCHRMTDEKLIGPGLKGITEIRRPEWIMNMMLNPMEMTQKDSLAKELLSIYYSQMLDNNLKTEEARSILEYLRSVDKN